jgi:hypothetical protein
MAAGQVWTQHASMHAWSDGELSSMLAETGLRLVRALDGEEDWLLAGQPAEPSGGRCTGRPAAAQAWKPPSRSVALRMPRRRSVAAARVDA